MAASTNDVREAVHQLAAVLLDDVERIARRSVSRMQGSLPSYAKVPRDDLLLITLANTRNLLEAVSDPTMDQSSAVGHFHVSGETRLSLGITADEMLQAWRIGLEVVREEARPVSRRLGVGDDALREFVEAILRWGDVGMRRSAAAYREAADRELEQLAAEQAALRRVAELVARQAPADEVFSIVTEELGHLLEVTTVRMVRFELDGSATVLGAHGVRDERLSTGINFPIPAGSVIETVLRTGRPARLDDFGEVQGPIGSILREQGAGAGVGGPIVVDGRLWGAMAVGVRSANALPPGSEHRVAMFAELMSTAIANLESRSRVEQLAAEQAALRRVAELVARQAPAEHVFGVVTEELNRLLDVTTVGTGRFEPDGTVTIMAVTGTAQGEFPPGMSVALEGGSAIEQVFRTGRPAHIESYDNVRGQLGSVMRRLGAGWAAAGPIVVDGRLWGAMTANSGPGGVYPAGAERRVAQFAELVSTAISNIESRERIERLAAEQSALRRVATLVAREHSPDDLFAMLAVEVGILFGADAAEILRYEQEAAATMVAGWTASAIDLPIGERLPLDGENLAKHVQRTGLPGRKEDYNAARGPIAALSREVGIRCAVASPILVEGAVWGMIAVASRGSERMPADTEERLAEFSSHAAVSVANAKSRADLADSRARIVRAGDEARRRFERDLHDGAQQRLVSLGLELRAAEATVPPDLSEAHRRLSAVGAGLNGVLDNLREISRGLHPAVLSEDGLGPALGSLALRSVVPVQLHLSLASGRFDDAVEAAAYYVVSEALTNAAKHAGASRVDVSARPGEGTLELTVSDDGVGGADPARGSGLTGLTDRVEAIGGSLSIQSPPGRGTTIQVKLRVTPISG
jgi:signal transduction histidine kinase